MPAPVKDYQFYNGLSFWAGDRLLVRATAAVTITLWDVMTQQRVGHWKAHNDECVWLGFVQGGRSIASAEGFIPPGVQAEIRLWRAPS